MYYTGILYMLQHDTSTNGDYYSRCLGAGIYQPVGHGGANIQNTNRPDDGYSETLAVWVCGGAQPGIQVGVETGVSLKSEYRNRDPRLQMKDSNQDDLKRTLTKHTCKNLCLLAHKK